MNMCLLLGFKGKTKTFCQLLITYIKFAQITIKMLILMKNKEFLEHVNAETYGTTVLQTCFGLLFEPQLLASILCIPSGRGVKMILMRMFLDDVIRFLWLILS